MEGFGQGDRGPNLPRCQPAWHALGQRNLRERHLVCGAECR